MAKKQKREDIIEDKNIEVEQQTQADAVEPVVREQRVDDYSKLTSEVIQQLKLLRSEDKADTLYGLKREFVKDKTFREVVQYVCEECKKNNVAPDRLAVVKFIKNKK